MEATRDFALGRYEFGRLGPARWTWWLAAAMALVAGISAADATSFASQLRSTFFWATWLIAVPIAAAVADHPEARAREEGVVALGELAGLSPRQRGVGSFAVAIFETSARMLLPLLTVALTALVRAPSASAMKGLLGVVLASLGAAALLLGTAWVCGHVAEDRGRRLWWAVLLLPWVLSRRLPLDISLVGGLERLAVRLLGGVA